MQPRNSFIPSIQKHVGICTLLCALTFTLTGCFTNLQEIFGTPTPSPTPNPAIEIDPEIDLDPIGGYAGTLVKVAGKGWMPGKLVILKLEDEEGRSGILAANIPDSTGQFQASFNYPGRSRWLNVGIQTIVAYALNEDLETTSQFVVIEPTAADTPTITSTSTNQPTNTSTPTLTFTPTLAETPTETTTPFEFLLLPTSTDAPATAVPPTNTRVDTPVDTPTPPPPTMTSSPNTPVPSTPVLNTPIPNTPVPNTPVPNTPVPNTPVPNTPASVDLATATPTLTATLVATITATQIQNLEGNTDETPNAPLIVNSDQITTPEPTSDTAQGNPNQPSADGTPSAVVVTVVVVTGPENSLPVATVPFVTTPLSGTVPLIDLAGNDPSGTPTEELRPFPTPAEPTPTSEVPTVTPTWTPLPAVVVIEEWRADYWDNPNLNGPAAVIRNEEEIDFNWGLGSPDADLPVEGFSARWSRTLFFQPGIYTFSAEMDDGARLFVDGQLLIDSWEEGGRRTLTAQKILSEGQHQIVFEYYENRGNAVARLGWEYRATFEGWRGEYFANPNLNGRPVLVRDDLRIDFEWGIDSPVPVLPEDGFSIRWQQRISFNAGTYRFRASADDGVRVWIDDLLVIDEWRDQSEQAFSVERTLTEGLHDIRVEYYENSLGAIIRFDWKEITAPTLVPSPTWTPAILQPTPTWTPAR